MSLLQKLRPVSGKAVLHVGPAAVEWFERDGDGVRHARVEVPEAEPGLLARAVEEAWRAAGGTTRGCVLALARPLSFHALVALPEIARKDLSAVFQRRGQALAGGAHSVYYLARDMDREDGEGGQPVRTSWLLAGLRGGVRDLRSLLHERGFRVHGVVSAELAALEWGRQRAPAPGEAVLVIVVGEVAVTVALVAGARLHYQQSIEGDLATRPSLASGLVHEIKTCAAFWRKRSRGQTVAQAVVVGLPRARVELLALTLASILPGVEVRAASEDERDATGRHGLLEAPLASGALNPALTFWLPMPRRRVAALAALAATAAIALSLVLFDSGEQRLRALRDEALGLRRATADLEDLRARSRAAEELVVEIARHLERGREIAAHGLPLERALSAVLFALDGRAELLELGLRADPELGAHLTLVGSCASEPAQLVGRLRDVLARLEQSGVLGELALGLPEEFGQTAAEAATFTIEGELEG
jgi:hypothetical protein